MGDRRRINGERPRRTTRRGRINSRRMKPGQPAGRGKPVLQAYTKRGADGSEGCGIARQADAPEDDTEPGSSRGWRAQMHDPSPLGQRVREWRACVPRSPLVRRVRDREQQRPYHGRCVACRECPSSDGRPGRPARAGHHENGLSPEREPAAAGPDRGSGDEARRLAIRGEANQLSPPAGGPGGLAALIAASTAPARVSCRDVAEPAGDGSGAGGGSRCRGRRRA
jgi:hypothetical protein